MYETHFGLRQRPFRTTPDTTHYYPATTHERALARLLQALSDREGFVLLTSEPGLGKTLLCHAVLQRLGQDVTSAFLTNGHVPDRLGLLQAISHELSLTHEGCTEQETRLALTTFLLENFKAGRQTVLIVDEAHHLVPDLLEELRMLGNLEGSSGRAIQIILSALPEVADVLELRPLAALRQRLATRVRLDPLGMEEAADYLRHQIRVAGGRPDVLLAEEAVLLLTQATNGIPRLLNQAAHHALVLANQAGAVQVDVEAALEALTALGLQPEETDSLLASDLEATRGPALDEDSGPLLSLQDPVLGLGPTVPGAAFANDPDNRSDYERRIPPKRPA